LMAGPDNNDVDMFLAHSPSIKFLPSSSESKLSHVH